MPGKIHVPVTVATQGFDKLQRTFSRLKIATGALTVAFAGLQTAGRAIDFTGAAIQGARDLERNYAGLESVFKEATQQMKDFGTSASEMGLSMNEAAKATTFIGSVLKQSGFSIAETADLTEELVELGADLALTYGYDVQEALLGMTALFRGEYDPIEKFGVAMKQSEIDAEKAARGLDGLTGAAERFADQQIRVEFLMERAGDAMGAFERQSGNLTVQQMRLRAEFENIRDTIADDLLPPLADFTGGIREIVQDVGPKLQKTFDNLAPVLENISDDILNLVDNGIDLLISSFDSLIEFLDRATDTSTDLGLSYHNLFTAVQDLVTGLGEMLEPVIAFAEDHGPSFDEVLVTINDSLAEMLDFVERNKEVIALLTGAFLANKAAVAAAAGAQVAYNIALGTTVRLLSLTPFGAIALGVGVLATAIDFFGEETSKAKKELEKLNDEMSRTEELEVYKNVLAEVESEQGMVTIGSGQMGEQFLQDAQAAAKAGMSLEEYWKEIGKTKVETEELNDTRLDGLEGRFGALFKRVLDVRSATASLLEGMTELEKAQAIMTPENVNQIGVTDAMRDAIAEFNKELRGDDDGEGGAAGTAIDYVANFFDGIAEGIEKEAARLDLEDLGLSKALIDQILGSEGWNELFQTIVDGGADMARQLQMDFNQTAEGMAELVKNAEDLAAELDKLREKEEDLKQQIIDTKNQQSDAIADATKQFEDFTAGINTTVDALQTYERQIGRFESQTRSDLQRIEQQVMSAFDNGYLLEEAKNNLLEYARAELNALAGLQRQRDELLGQRNAAADSIFSIAKAVTSAGNITSLLKDVQDEVKEVQVKELFEDVVESADGLNGFKVTLERNYTDVITNTVSKSKALVNGFQDVIDRTRAFIDNLKLLREMGLDPFLFNQLVQAGAEAGGATAQALVEGGAETVNEVNSLQSELESMGVELGEQTYEVTKNSGEQFVSGIIDGMDAELERLGEKAIEAANGFTEAFELSFKAGMDTAFDGIIEGIRLEFKILIDELNAELKDLLAQIAATEAEAKQAAKDAGLAGRVASGQSIVVDGVEVQEGSSSINAGNIGDLPSSEQAFLRDAFPELFPSSSGSGQTVNVYNVNANNPLDAYNASKGNVEQQANFQSANGNISATLTGVGN